MSVVERLLTEVRTLSERQAREVMKYIGALKRVNDGEDRLAEEETARQDWAEFERLGGGWSGRFERSDCYDSPRFR